MQLWNHKKIMWVKRLLCNKMHPWINFFKRELRILGDERFIFNRNLDLKAIKNSKMSKNYKEIVLAWAEYIRKPVHNTNILDQQLFYNQAIITGNGNSIFHKILFPNFFLYQGYYSR